MTKDYTVNHSLNKSSIGSIRKAIFDQRKSAYLERTHDRPAVFIDQPIKHINYARQNKMQ